MEELISSISADTRASLLAAVFILILIARGYKRGILVELSGLIALLASFLGLILLEPYLPGLFPDAFGRLPRMAVCLLLCFLMFRIVKSLVDRIGKIFRKVPVLGFLTGVLGAAAGCLKAVLVILIIQSSLNIK